MATEVDARARTDLTTSHEDGTYEEPTARGRQALELRDLLIHQVARHDSASMLQCRL